MDADAGSSGFEETNPLLVDGQLAWALTSGGADGREFAGSAADAERLGSAACAGLIGDRYEDVRVDRSQESWSGWFRAVVRDDTWVLTGAHEARVTFLYLTDTD